MLQQFYIRVHITKQRMDNQDDIPMGLGQPMPPDETVKAVCYPGENPGLETNNMNVLDGMNRTTPEPQFSENCRRKSSRQGSREQEKYRTKAISENYDLRSKGQKESLLEQIVKPLKKQEGTHEHQPSKRQKKHRQPIKLPPTKPRNIILTEPTEHSRSHNIHHFNRKDYLNQKILQDVDKYPIKYKIMCEVFGCKPHAAYEMHKEETEHIQEEYTRQKGLEYLREGNARAKYQYVRDQRVNSQNRPTRIRMRTESTSKIIKTKAASSAPHARIKISKSQKLLKLSNKQTIQGQKVYDRVKKHINHNEQYSHNYFKHLTSEQSIDHALVNFLRTKIKRAEVVLK